MIQDSKEMIRMDEEGDGGLMRRFRSKDRYMRNRGVFAVLAVAIMLTAAVGCSVTVEETEESDGFVVTMIASTVVIKYVVAAFLAGAIVGAIAGNLATSWILDEKNQTVQPYSRLFVIQDIADTLSVANGFSVNAMKNYSQIWSLTKEHWIRQAELQVYTEWASGKSYDASSVMSNSYIYDNTAMMNANSVTQMNIFFDSLSQSFKSLDGADAYDDKVDLSFILNSSKYSSNGTFDWNAKMASVVSVPSSSSSGTVYIGNIDETYVDGETMEESTEVTYHPGFIYNPGSATTIRNGTSAYTIANGTNYIDELKIKPGIYTISRGTTLASDAFAQTVGQSSSLDLHAGLIMSAGGSENLAVWNWNTSKSSTWINLNGTSGTQYSSIEIYPTADDTPADEKDKLPQPIDITDQLSSYQALLDKMYWINVSASSAASSVWALYDEMRSKNYAVTTLMNSYNYGSGIMSDAMYEAMTISAMSQLSEWYQENGDDLSDLDIALYSNSMDSFFVRGTIYDEYGEPLYKDVIFTPFLQSTDATLSAGSTYQIDQNCLVTIWADGKEWSTWYSNEMRTSTYNTVMLNKGSIEVSKIATCDSNGMHEKSSLNLKINRVNYVKGEGITFTPKPTPDAGEVNWLKIIAIASGVILAIYGLVSRRIELTVFGVILLAFGLLVADTLWDRLSEWL